MKGKQADSLKIKTAIYIGWKNSFENSGIRHTIIWAGEASKAACEVALIYDRYYASTPAVERVCALLDILCYDVAGRIRVWRPSVGAEELFTSRLSRALAASGLENLPIAGLNLLFSSFSLDPSDRSPRNAKEYLLLCLGPYIDQNGGLRETAILPLFQALAAAVRTGNDPVKVVAAFARAQAIEDAGSIIEFKPGIFGLNFDLKKLASLLFAAAKSAIGKER